MPAAQPAGPRRIVVLVAVVLVLSAPLAVLFGALWHNRATEHGFTSSERDGVRYLGPLTQLISTVTMQQSSAVRGKPADHGAIDRAVAAVDAVDARYGEKLGTTQRWTALRETVKEVGGLRIVQPTDAFSVYSELMDTAIALVRKVGDSSNLILDPRLDTYYVMNAAVLRIPEVLVDAGRYADLVYLVVGASQQTQTERVGQLSTARSTVLASAADLEDGLEKAFDVTTSGSLGPALLRPLDNFRTTVDALLPRNGPLAAASIKVNPTVVDGSANDVQGTALALDRAALDQLDKLLSARISGQVRAQVLALVLLAVGIALAVAVAVWPALRSRPRRDPDGGQPPMPARHGEGWGPESVDARQLVASNGMPVQQRRGGARAAR